MWVARELARLLMRIVIGTAVALGIAAILAALSSQSFHSDARVLCIVIGCMLLAMAGIGRGSNVERYMDTSVTRVAWGVIPGFDAFKRNPEDPTLAPSAAFLCSGVAVIAIGVLL
ncbi:MAG: hypothetical protein ACRDLK_04205 [Gaiellaceae bacterium]